MSAVWKLIMSLYSLLIIALSIIVAAVAVGIKQPLAWPQLIVENQDARIIAIVVAVFFFFIAFNILVRSLAAGPSSETSILIQDTANGSVVITIPAIKQMIMKAVRHVEGVREVKPEVGSGKNGLVIYLTVMVSPEYKLPELTATVQVKVRDHLEQLGGLTIASVEVKVDDFVTRPVVR
ncbi:MAG: alkaline shock response membrane anchor protein AmaP [Candidatus Saccharibacteria bacterium]